MNLIYTTDITIDEEDGSLLLEPTFIPAHEEPVHTSRAMEILNAVHEEDLAAWREQTLPVHPDNDWTNDDR